MSTRDQLLADIEAFLKRSGMSATEFGRGVMNDVALIGRLRAGRDVTTATADKCREFIRRHGASRSRPTRRRTETAVPA